MNNNKGSYFKTTKFKEKNDLVLSAEFFCDNLKCPISKLQIKFEHTFAFSKLILPCPLCKKTLGFSYYLRTEDIFTGKQNE